MLFGQIWANQISSLDLVQFWYNIPNICLINKKHNQKAPINVNGQHEFIDSPGRRRKMGGGGEISDFLLNLDVLA